MYSGKYFPWDQYPKFLRFDEVQDPFSVVVSYFDGTRPTEQRKELKEWRKYVMRDKHYNHQHGPGSLLFISDEHIRLLEACYLLSLQHSSYELRKTDLVSHGTLSKGREQWSYFPDDLSEKELKNPYRALKKMFKKYSLAEYRDYLKEWLHAALYNSRIDETMTAGEIVTVYENMKKLVSAAWIIRQTEGDSPMLKREFNNKDEGDSKEEGKGGEAKQEKDEKAEIQDSAIESTDHRLLIAKDAIKIKPFAPQLTPAEKLGLDEVVAWIINEVPSVQSITYLGSYPTPFTFYLLILVDDSEKMPEHSIVNKIEDNCRNLVSVYALVHKVQSAVTGLKKGGRFWTAALRKGINLYMVDDLILPKSLEITGEEEHMRATSNWERWGKQGRDFLKGAAHYIKEENYKLAIFMLHQAAESTLIGVIKVLFGYRQSVHNLSKLLRLTLLFTDELMAVFQLHDPDRAEVFTLLSNGYSEARYKEGFNPDPYAVVAAQVKVELLIAKAGLICLKVIDG
jgi:HEPN domain-containing protein